MRKLLPQFQQFFFRMQRQRVLALNCVFACHRGMPIYIYTSVFLAHLQQQVIFIFFALHNEEDRPTISSTHHAVSVSPLSQNRGAPE